MKLSVILPLVDSRGSAEESLSAWTNQTLAAHEYEIVVASPAPAPAVAAQLRPHDRMQLARGGAEIDLYAAGCASSRGEILLLTESHCIPSRDCAAELICWFEQTDAAAAHVDGPGISRSALARMEERMNVEYRLGQDGVDDWQIASLRGFAVRRAAFEAAGGLDVALGRLAERALGLELLRQGFHIGRAPNAVVHHVNCAHWSDLAPATRGYGRGLSAHWTLCERRGATPMLAPAAEFRRRAMSSKPIARLACRLLLASLVPTNAAEPWGFRAARAGRALPSLLMAACFDRRAALIAARLRVARARAACRLAARHDERLYAAFCRALRELTRLGIIEAMRPGAPASLPTAARSVLRPGDMPDGQLAGFHASEDWNGEQARWCEPLAIVRLDLACGRYRVSVDAMSPCEPFHRRGLRLYFNHHEIACAVAGGEQATVSLVLEPRFFRLGEQYLAFLCSPLPRRYYDPDDPRELGIAIREIRFERC